MKWPILFTAVASLLAATAWGQKGPSDPAEQVKSLGTVSEAQLLFRRQPMDNHTRRYALQRLPELAQKGGFRKLPADLEYEVNESLRDNDGLLVREAVRVAGAVKVAGAGRTMAETYSAADSRYGQQANSVRMSVAAAIDGYKDEVDVSSTLCSFLEERKDHLFDEDVPILLQAMVRNPNAGCVDECKRLIALLTIAKEQSVKKQDYYYAQKCDELIGYLTRIVGAN